jgi:two-component system OmpR family response regulator
LPGIGDDRAVTATPHIVVVDDDPEIRRLLARFLRQNGFRVTGVRSAAELKVAMGEVAVDLLILDLMLPGTDGLQICQELRRSSAIPVIMLTAKGDETDRIVGLEVGADDYLPKPFSPRELLARIRAVLRRAGAGPTTAWPAVGHTFAFAGWRLDTIRRELTAADGTIVDLTTGEYDLLLAFLEHPGRVLSRDLLLDLAKNRGAIPFDRSIDVQVSRLRRKLEEEGSGSSMIKTVRGAGYLFTASVCRE